MPRRIPFQENAHYHVYNRWLDKKTIFFEEKNYERFLYYCSLRQEKYKKSMKICAYCLLPNHFHFVIHNLQVESTISNFISKVTASYAKYLAAKYALPTGYSLFEGRFKAKLIDSEDYLNQCISYVELNPLKHQIVERGEDWLFTSYDQTKKQDEKVLGFDREF